MPAVQARSKARLPSLASSSWVVKRIWVKVRVSEKVVQNFAPFSKPSWKPEIRSKPLPCACRSSAPPPSGSRKSR